MKGLLKVVGASVLVACGGGAMAQTPVSSADVVQAAQRRGCEIKPPIADMPEYATFVCNGDAYTVGPNDGGGSIVSCWKGSTDDCSKRVKALLGSRP